MTDAERYAIVVRKVLVDDQELWRATVRELPDLAEFGETREEAIELALDAIENLKKAAEEEGRPFPEPLEDEEEYSGRVTLRMSKSLHRAAALRAQTEDVSLNSYIVECIALQSAADAAVRSLDAALVGRFDYKAPLRSIDYNKYFSRVSNYLIVTTDAAAAAAGREPVSFGHQYAIGTATQWDVQTMTERFPEKKRAAA